MNREELEKELGQPDCVPNTILFQIILSHLEALDLLAEKVKEIEKLKGKAREVVLQWQKVTNLGMSNDITHKFRTLIADLQDSILGRKEE